MGDGPARPARFHRIHYLIAALIPALVIALSVTGFVWANKGVTLVVDGESRYVKTRAVSVRDFLDDAGITVGDKDVVTPSLGAAVADGSTVLVRHAIPVTVSFSGETVELDVVGSTVADALVAAGIDSGCGISVTPALDTPLADGLAIEATDVFVRIVEEQAEVGFDVVTENDPTSLQGERTVKQAGEPGRVLNVYRVLVTKGEEGTRTLTAEHVIAEPIDEIVAVGTKRSNATLVASRARTTPAASSPGPAPATGKQLTVVATGYSAQDPGVGTRTATGASARRGVIAVDPSVIPLGTRVQIPGYGTAVAADTGGAISGGRIDLCFNTRAEALAWGRRTVTVTLLP